MEQLLAAVIFAGAALMQMPVAGAISGQNAPPPAPLKSEIASDALSDLPPVPKGKSTILGGEIRDVDPVHNSFALKAPGQRALKVLFDERTKVYLDGKRIPLRDLHPVDHGSIQTVLDGTNVFAVSIHILSQSSNGDYQGYVQSYNQSTRVLVVNTATSTKPFRLLVPVNTPVARAGDPAFSSAPSGQADLIKGSLISVTFESDKQGNGIAKKIAILATPGFAFLFRGNLSSLDMHSGFMVLVDPRDNKRYEIFFDAIRLPASQDLHEGDSVVVTATFDGAHYLASAIKIN
jgi:hypothetical protein